MANVTIRSLWIVLCLLVLSAGLYIGTAGSPALDDEDVDAAHALVSQEMLQRNDFVVLYMDGVRYLIRPPMHFWMVAASYKLLGENEFATRLPMGLAMVGMALLTFEFGGRFFGQRAGLYGALAAATSVGMFIFTRTMIPEPIYALAFEAIFYLFLRSWTGSLDPRVGYWGAAALCARCCIGARADRTALSRSRYDRGIHHDDPWLAPLAQASPVFQARRFFWQRRRSVAHPGWIALTRLFLGLISSNEHISRASGDTPTS